MSVKIDECGVVTTNKELPLNSKRLVFDIKISTQVRSLTQGWEVRAILPLHVVLMNLLACTNKKQRLFYSRQKNAKRKDNYNNRGINNYAIIAAVDELQELGYLYNYVADRQYRDEDNKAMSWLYPTTKFIERFCKESSKSDEAEVAYLQANPNLELKDKKKQKIGFSEDDTTKEMARVVASLNDMNRKHSFVTKDGEIISNVYTRIFNDNSFSLGGRFHKAGILNMRHKVSKDRLRVRIDEEPVCEVDFDCLHITILADEKGIADKYTGDIYYKVLEPHQYSDANRALVKLGVNICLNARSTLAAAGAIDKHLKNVPDGLYCFKDGVELVKAIKSKLHDFKDAFCNKQSTGLRLQNIDSHIAHLIVDEFVKVQYPILVVHDSFVVQKKHASMLIDVMSYAYKRIVKVDKTVPMTMWWIEDDIVRKTELRK